MLSVFFVKKLGKNDGEFPLLVTNAFRPMAHRFVLFLSSLKITRPLFFVCTFFLYLRDKFQKK